MVCGAWVIVRTVDALPPLKLLSPEYVTAIVCEPATVPSPRPVEDEPALSVDVVQAPPLIVQVSDPVAPPTTVVVQLVTCEPYVMGLGEHDSDTVGVALLIVNVVEAVAVL
jgi:hypothetical protein